MKFRVKITLCMLALLSLLFGIGGSALIVSSFQDGLEREKKTAENTYKMLQYTLQISGERELLSQTMGIKDTIGQIVRQSGGYWDDVLLTSDGEEIYRGREKAKYLDGAQRRPGDERGLVSSVQDGTGKRYLCVSGTFSAGERMFELAAAHEITELYENRERQQQLYRAVFAVLILLGAVLAYSTAFVLTAPLSRLSKGAREIAGGNFGFRSRVCSGDEVGGLARDFDRMAGQIEQNVRKLREAVERQERFVGSFTHELKTPMTSVIGYADLLRSRELSEEERREAADYIFREGKRLERLSLKLLAIYAAEQTELSLTSCSPGKIVADAAAHLKDPLKEKGIRLTVKCDRGTCILDPDLFRSLALNLIDNAAKALGNRGEIAVTVRTAAGECRLCVEDDGPGIPKEARAHLTEAFYRADKSRSRAQGGAGLGLTLCAKIAELHGGNISFQSTEGQGTKVTVYLKGGNSES